MREFNNEVSSLCILAKLWNREDKIKPKAFYFVTLSIKKAFVGIYKVYLFILPTFVHSFCSTPKRSAILFHESIAFCGLLSTSCSLSYFFCFNRLNKSLSMCISWLFIVMSLRRFLLRAKERWTTKPTKNCAHILGSSHLTNNWRSNHQ